MKINRDLIKHKRLAENIAVNILRYLFLIAFSYVLLCPLIYILANVFKDPKEFYDPSIIWIPKHFSLNGLKHAVTGLKLKETLPNTLIYEMIAAVIEIFSCAVAAYGLARYNFKGKKAVIVLMMLTILVPVNMIIIPSYVNFQYMDFLGILGGIGKLVGTELRPQLIDTPFVFWLPSVCAVGLKGGFFIYIYMQFFKGLPKELEEAAWIDGAGSWRTFMTIIMPSSGVAMLTVSLFSFVWHWNDYYLASMYLLENVTLCVQLSRLPINLSGMGSIEDAASGLGVGIMAGCLIFILPMLILYLILQKRFISSIANTGIVG